MIEDPGDFSASAEAVTAAETVAMAETTAAAELVAGKAPLAAFL